jgi:hypothetical protein
MLLRSRFKKARPVPGRLQAAKLVGILALAAGFAALTPALSASADVASASHAQHSSAATQVSPATIKAQNCTSKNLYPHAFHGTFILIPTKAQRTLCIEGTGTTTGAVNPLVKVCAGNNYGSFIIDYHHVGLKNPIQHAPITFKPGYTHTFGVNLTTGHWFYDNLVKITITKSGGSATCP